MFSLHTRRRTKNHNIHVDLTFIKNLNLIVTTSATAYLAYVLYNLSILNISLSLNNRCV